MATTRLGPRYGTDRKQKVASLETFHVAKLEAEDKQ
jgi:hypothetical protein